MISLMGGNRQSDTECHFGTEEPLCSLLHKIPWGEGRIGKFAEGFPSLVAMGIPVCDSELTPSPIAQGRRWKPRYGLPSEAMYPPRGQKTLISAVFDSFGVKPASWR